MRTTITTETPDFSLTITAEVDDDRLPQPEGGMDDLVATRLQVGRIATSHVEGISGLMVRAILAVYGMWVELEQEDHPAGHGPAGTHDQEQA
ncbi:hypothetical protein [uncultured Actinomyces sp.]|jgi:hypothetical protein|uniref:hypothetical protein n=1 Tax=uncultured Actinomyces sp. TaxID=249061 RepID=UPI002804DD3C|nr:hypothetical protein [uncultured Actinomyces sp.]